MRHQTQEVLNSADNFFYNFFHTALALTACLSVFPETGFLSDKAFMTCLFSCLCWSSHLQISVTPKSYILQELFDDHDYSKRPGCQRVHQNRTVSLKGTNMLLLFRRCALAWREARASAKWQKEVAEEMKPSLWVSVRRWADHTVTLHQQTKRALYAPILHATSGHCCNASQMWALPSHMVHSV